MPGDTRVVDEIYIVCDHTLEFSTYICDSKSILQHTKNLCYNNERRS